MLGNPHIVTSNPHVEQSNYSIARSNYGITPSNYSIALSNYNIARSNYGITQSNYCIALSNYGIAPGNYCIAQNNYDIAVSNYGIALNYYSFAHKDAGIDILLSAPIHLNSLLIPTILSHGKPSKIVNVTSGGAYIPQIFAPVYSACKSAIRSYTITLRHSLSDTNCNVIELIPPAVQTSLADGNTGHGVLLEDFSEAVFRKLMTDGITKIGFGQTENIEFEFSGKPLNEIFETLSKRFEVKTYKN